MKVDAGRRFEQCEDVADLFPGLSEKLDDLEGDSSLAVVGDFCARELVLVGASVLLGKRDLAAECAMVIWHHDDDGRPDEVAAALEAFWQLATA